MSHHFELPPELDWKVRAWIRQHKRGLRFGILAALVIAFILAMGVLWGVFAGASHLLKRFASKAPTLIPAAWERQLGAVALAQLRSQIRFIEDPLLMESLRRLADPLLNTIPDKSYPFTLYIAESMEVNAFALPGGHIVFNRGLLDWAKTPEEIQGVLAHEAAHVLKRHSLTQMAQNLGIGLAFGQLMGNENRLLDALIQDASKLVSLKFSRDHEREADDLGWDLLQSAGIDPSGMVDFFVRLQADATKSIGGPPALNLLSTHPTPQERIDRLEKKKEALVPGTFKTFEGEFKNLRNRLLPTLERVSRWFPLWTINSGLAT
jgi:predicted Zn-dependent protease